MRTGSKPWWQQATALVTVSTGGVITGFNLVPGATETMTAPTAVPLHLLALEQAARSVTPGETGADAGNAAADAQLRAAIANTVGYYLQLAKGETADQLDALLQDKTAPGQPDGASADVPGMPGAAAFAGSGGIPGAGAGPVDSGADAGKDASVPGLLSVTSSLATARGVAAVPGASPVPAAPATPAAPAAHKGHVTTPTTPKATPPNTRVAPAAPKASAPAPAASPAPTPTSPTSTPSGSSPSSASTATQAQQAFIASVEPGAVAAQQQYGVPAAVTIAQAIDESGWGKSSLAAQYHNLFGVKGDGPAGSVTLPTQEYQGGKWVTIDAQFAVYASDAQSIADHAELLATSGYYTHAMANRDDANAFANDLTGVYATDPNYGANLIALMTHYNLYQYDTTAAPAPTPAATPTATPTPTVTPTTPAASPTATPTSTPAATGDDTVPGMFAPSTPAAAPTTAAAPASTTAPVSTPAATPAPTGPGNASAPGAIAPSTPAATPTSASGRAVPDTGTGTATNVGIPGVVSPGPVTSAATSPAQGSPTRQAPAATNVGIPGVVSPASAAVPAAGLAGIVLGGAGLAGAGLAGAAQRRRQAARYEEPLPQATLTALFANAKGPLSRGEHLYRDVVHSTGGSWELLAAVDWMQCRADHRYSPVQGEKLGSFNFDGTSYPTKSAALTQCARDLISLAERVYSIDLTARRPLSVRELAAAFAAFRWGALLQRHGVSPMEFPYSVAGLTPAHQKMHWPSIDAPDVPDRPGSRFREPFGAVPVVLSLGYHATVD